MIRELQDKDLPLLREWHEATGFEWEFPEQMFSARVWVDANDDPVMMIGAKIIAEAVLISSKKETPGMRLAILKALFHEVRQECLAAGISEGITWVPDSIWKSYSKRLAGMGWLKSKYRTMCFFTKGTNAKRG